MTGMNNAFISMAIQTTDGQAIILENSLDTGITRLDTGGPGRVMAPGATADMNGLNSGPSVGEVAMAGITGRAGREVDSSLQDSMGCCRVVGMTIEVGGVAAVALAASRMANGTALQHASDQGMAGIAGQVDLAAADKRGGGRDMTP